MLERGATEAEVIATIREGTAEPAQRGLTLFRHNHPFHAAWGGVSYDVKQVACIVALEPNRLVVVTVYTFFFQERVPS